MPILPLATRPLGWAGEFKAFLARGNVVDLAVGIVIGAAFTGIVQSLVKDILNPFIGMATGGVDFSELFVTLKGPVKETVAAAKSAGAVTVNYGLFVNAVIQFLIVALVVFLLVKALTRLRVTAPAAAAGPTASEVLLTQIRDELKAQRPAAAPSATLRAVE